MCYHGNQRDQLRLQFSTRFESRYHRQILYTFVEDKETFKELLGQFKDLPEPLQDLVTRELTRDMLARVTALYAWVDDHYEVAT